MLNFRGYKFSLVYKDASVFHVTNNGCGEGNTSARGRQCPLQGPPSLSAGLSCLREVAAPPCYQYISFVNGSRYYMYALQVHVVVRATGWLIGVTPVRHRYTNSSNNGPPIPRTAVAPGCGLDRPRLH